MLNDIKPPPVQADEPQRQGHHLKPHTDANEPGKHHARVLGEPTHIDPIYSMPLEERGSGFNIGITIIALVLFVTLLFAAWWTLG